MARSLKKGPHIDGHLLKKVEELNQKNEKKVNLVGDRMARVRQRLALNDDPGKTTQIIEDRIVTDLDILIDQARRQQAQTRNTPRLFEGLRPVGPNDPHRAGRQVRLPVA